MSEEDMINVVRLAVQNDQQQKHELLTELNRDNCVVLDGARTKVLRFEDDEYAAGGEHYVYQVPTFLTFDDFRNLYLNRHINVGNEEEPKWIDIGKWWLHHRDRRQYRGVIFKPGGEGVVDGKLNLWRGWGVEPKRGEWGLLREHIFEVLAARDDDVDRYTFNWMAWAVQHPAEQAETAVVFIGEPGTGKGTLGKALCRIFGQHALHLSAADDLTGKFNAHLRQCSFLFGDECYGPKDKRAEGQLKRMITENTLMIEPKGRDKVRVQNRLHTMLASNSDWVIPAGAYERRYVVQRVADTHRQDAQWFEPIYQELKDGGYEAMLFDLLTHDLGNWHPRQIVRTAALAQQQVESLEPFDTWWLELLHDGYLPAGDSAGAVISGDYQVRRSEGYLTDNSKRTWFERRKGLYEQARASSPGLKSKADAAFGRYLTKQSCEGGDVWVCRRRGWVFPPLAQCRAKWLERFPDTVWRNPKANAWKGERDDDEDA
jgi:hypothetical protein